MGKIKQKMIKKSGKTLVEKGIEFTEDFKENKRILGDTMPSKKVRNQLAGYLVRLKKQEEKNRINIPTK